MSLCFFTVSLEALAMQEQAQKQTQEHEFLFHHENGLDTRTSLNLHSVISALGRSLIVVLHFIGHRTTELLGLVGPKVWSVWNYSIPVHVQSTSAWRTTHYYGHLAITDEREIPGWNHKEIYENSSHYNGRSLLQTYGHFARSRTKMLIIFLLL